MWYHLSWYLGDHCWREHWTQDSDFVHNVSIDMANAMNPEARLQIEKFVILDSKTIVPRNPIPLKEII